MNQEDTVQTLRAMYKDSAMRRIVATPVYQKTRVEKTTYC